MTERPCLYRRSNALNYFQTPHNIRKLRRFLGKSKLEAALNKLHRELKHHGAAYQFWARDELPWLFALQDYDESTQGNNVLPEEWSTTALSLSADGLMLSRLRYSMPSVVYEKYATDLLDQQHHNFLHEIRIAWHYYLRGFDIGWYLPGQSHIPEFRVIGGGLDFDVECRRFNIDVTEYIKSKAVASLCDRLYAILRRRNVWGEVAISLQRAFTYNSSEFADWGEIIGEALDAGLTNMDLGQFIHIGFELKPSPSPPYSPSELESSLHGLAGPQFVVITSERSGEVGLNPIIFRCQAPRRTPDQIRDNVYKTLKEKVRNQFSSDRPGVLVVKFEGVTDPQVFNDSEGMQSVLAKLFSNSQLAAICFRCQDEVIRDANSTKTAGKAIVFRNPNSKFQEVAVAHYDLSFN